MKRVIIIHGWAGSPDGCWKPWLKKELESSGFKVVVPQMPDAANPRLKRWRSMISHIVDKPDDETYLVGHSLGCVAICRYLESLKPAAKIGGCVFVGGFSSALKYRETAEFTAEPLQAEKIKSHTTKFVLIHSKDDQSVPVEKAHEFHNALGGELIIEDGKGHYSDDDNCVELPAARDAILGFLK